MARESIFITGAGSGIGHATARLFASRGWFVGLYDVDEEAVRSLRDALGDENATCARVDVTDIESLRSAVEVFSDRTGGTMDVLFNNAGILSMGRFEEIPLERHHRIIDVNVNGSINTIMAAFDLLRDTDGARIISTSSASALYGVPEHASYSASKFALRALTESLEIEFARHGIEVSDVMPAYVSTPMVTEHEEPATTVKSMGVSLSAEDVAQKVWHAAHNHKTHHVLGDAQTRAGAAAMFGPAGLFKRALRRMLSR